MNTKAVESVLLERDNLTVLRLTLMKNVTINMRMYKSEQDNLRFRLQLNPLNEMLETEKIRTRPLIAILSKYYRDSRSNRENPPDFPEDQLNRKFGSPGAHLTWLAAYNWILHHMKSILNEVPSDW